MTSVLSPAGPDAFILARLSWLLFAAGAVIFVLVAVVALASIRRRSGWRPSSRMLVFGGGVLLPVPLLAALMAWTGWQTSQLTWPFSQEARWHVTVTGHMWWWEVRYRDAATGREAVVANELRLPAGERVYLALGSSDVVHAFWVPALAGKVDMVPGRLHGLTVKADRAGRYRGLCAEYCGAQHTAMQLDVSVEPRTQFEAWLARQAEPAAPPRADRAPGTATPPVQPHGAPNAATSAGPPPGASGATQATATPRGAGGGRGGAAAMARAAARGREVFLQARCNACHSVRGVADGGAVAPDLTHIASRSHIGAGVLPMNRAALMAWIANPQDAKPGARMPPTRLPPEDLEALATWLETLQ